ncbi:PREDICTED: uncharacterized protein LOC104774132 [Camelina sativa]|uniref:Uncharacterized protein LOC104759517 n=1 Tax=Camelina sativa TaxID=90675 RepID=A0ABM0X4W4_CAMSA|nr:PREDICTED: uncharacterized protein LOC104759517 [Camelina sativa]XP_010497102.1 PREDICTED: uncharacterized protein LOC104774132 [Camelina sativa]
MMKNDDTETSTSKQKEGGGPSSIKCPMLSTSNYTVSAMRMRILLRVNKVWDAIETEDKDEDMNDLAMALLFQSIPESLILQVGELDTAKKVWDAIKSRHVGAERVKEARLQTLMAEFDRIKMKDSETIDDFAGNLSAISSKSAALGEDIEESKLVKNFLKCLPRKKYIHMVASLEQVLDLNKTSFADIVGRMKAYEERIAEEEEVLEDQNKLMYTNSEPQAPQSNRFEQNRDFNGGYYGGYRGRGRGGRFRGRGRGRFNGARDFLKVECFRCDKLGHYASECPDRLLKLQETQETDIKDTEEADELMMHEIVFLNEKKVDPKKYETDTKEDNVWYLDNGASNHMTGDRRYFSSLDTTITGKVRFGDDSRVDIKGNGSIEFVDMNGEERTMSSVYYIPDLKSSIISLGQATEVGFDVRMRGEDLTMHDTDGKLVVKTTRSRNRLYKVRMNIKDHMCLSVKVLSESNKWHARLGHINLETMRSMIQRR